MSTAQKSTGNKHQLLNDREVHQDYKTSQINQTTAWTDSRKAPYINTGVGLFLLYMAISAQITLIRNSVGLWKTTIEANLKSP